jgi:HD-like signal output (HDOD) protein/DNA-binding CsgD family transcriptional regulator
MSEPKTKSGANGDRRAGAGGHRLAAAFEAVSELPALAEARRRVIVLCERQTASAGDLADAVEADTGLSIAVMRAANNGGGPPGRVAGVRGAIDSLHIDGVRKLAVDTETYDVLERPGSWSDRHERFRRHAVAVRSATDRIGDVARLGQRDELAIASLVHDVGRLVIAELYGEEHATADHTETPEDRVHTERRELGIDHALVGAVLIRRWGLRSPVAAAVERHHATDASGHAAAIRLGDMIVHHAAGDPVSAEAMRATAAALELSDDQLRSLLFDYPYAGDRRRRSSEPCPLSVREIDALRGLAEGKVYKQIAQELSLSVSTVRTHLHNVYRKIGAVDRAQAVLIARDRGWL